MAPGVEVKAPLSVAELGFSLHAATVVRAGDRAGRGGLCYYVLRPPPLSPARGPPFFRSKAVRRKLGELDGDARQLEIIAPASLWQWSFALPVTAPPGAHPAQPSRPSPTCDQRRDRRRDPPSPGATIATIADLALGSGKTPWRCASRKSESPPGVRRTPRG